MEKNKTEEIDTIKVKIFKFCSTYTKFKKMKNECRKEVQTFQNLCISTNKSYLTIFRPWKIY